MVNFTTVGFLDPSVVSSFIGGISCVHSRISLQYSSGGETSVCLPVFEHLLLLSLGKTLDLFDEVPLDSFSARRLSY